ncbi:VOC family protein [Azohydromonas australica]|uniref:VOC family protein n=1 Tax=Azohydromonas australica TaxID=364039 RepID=UPI0009FF7217|nr:VOC family protein [Azohydromonas australica]
MTPLFNVFCRNIDRQFDFYQGILGWTEIKEASSPIYRVITGEGIQLGLNGWKAYDLLDLGNRKRADEENFGISTMLSFVVEQPSLVDEIAGRVGSLGGRIVKAPFATYYGHWQVVFCDPEGNVGRITSPRLPHGIEPAQVDI